MMQRNINHFDKRIKTLQKMEDNFSSKIMINENVFSLRERYKLYAFVKHSMELVE